MCGWTDDGSGISYIRYEVYCMQVNIHGQLDKTGTAVKVYNDHNFLRNNFRYTCETPGVYSVRLIVYDHASNYAEARKLFVYTGDSKMTSRSRLARITALLSIAFLCTIEYDEYTFAFLRTFVSAL